MSFEPDISGLREQILANAAFVLSNIRHEELQVLVDYNKGHQYPYSAYVVRTAIGKFAGHRHQVVARGIATATAALALQYLLAATAADLHVSEQWNEQTQKMFCPQGFGPGAFDIVWLQSEERRYEQEDTPPSSCEDTEQDANVAEPAMQRLAQQIRELVATASNGTVDAIVRPFGTQAQA